MAVEWSEASLADMAALDKAHAHRMKQAIERLAETGVGDVKKLQGVDPPEFRLRVGDFRVRFSLPGDQTVRVNRVQNRRDAYR